MRLLSKPVIIGGILGTIGLGTLAGVGIASAESGTSDNGDPMSSLVQKIATTFKLSEDEVQKVFDDEREAREAEREKTQTERLQALVDDGTITAAQKTAIEAKIKEMKAEREANKDSMKDLTGEERKAKMEERRTEMEAWAKEQGLDLSELHGVLMGGHGRGGMGGPGGPRPDAGENS